MINTIAHTTMGINHIDEMLNEQFNKLASRFTIQPKFSRSSVNFNIFKDWDRLKTHCKGIVLMREHYSSTHVKCVHNKWSKNAYLFIHRHDDADSMFWVHNGVLKIEIWDDTCTNLKSTKIIVFSDNDQPITINAGVNHKIIALEETDFVVRYNNVR